jgi:hypothetical protein
MFLPNVGLHCFFDSPTQSHQSLRLARLARTRTTSSSMADPTEEQEEDGEVRVDLLSGPPWRASPSFARIWRVDRYTKP